MAVSREDQQEIWNRQKREKVDTNVFPFIPDLSTHLPEYSRKCGAFRAALNIQHISTYIRHGKVLVDVLTLLEAR